MRLLAYGGFASSLRRLFGLAACFVTLCAPAQTPPPAFEPIFRGNGVADNTVTLKPSSADHRVFSFVIENPRSGADADLEIAVVATLSGKHKPPGLQIVTPAFKLPPGASHPVTLEFTSAIPAHGRMTGRLLVRDRISGTTRDLELVVQPDFTPLSLMLQIAGLVALGAVLSTLVGSVIPTLVNRSRLWKRLKGLYNEIGALPASEHRAGAALATRLHSIERVSRDIYWFSTRAADTLAETTRQADDLEARLALLARVGQARSDAQSGNSTPLSLLGDLNRVFEKVVDEAANRDLARAGERLDKALADMATEAQADSIRTRLATILPTLPQAAPAGSNPVMAQRLLRLLADHGRLGAAPALDELRRLDYEFCCARLYFSQYLGEVLLHHPDDPAFKTAEAALVDGLCRHAPGLLDATVLLESLRLGVTKAAVDAAFADLPACAAILTTPSAPRVGDLVVFELVFKDSHVNRSPLRFRSPVRWCFDDGSSDAFGLRVMHYFPRRGSSLFPRGMKAKVTASVGDAPNGKLTQAIRLQASSGLGNIVARAEVLSFVIVLAGAIALALIANQASMRPLENVQDYLNPFLWGFGLDQMKSLVGKRSA